MKGKNLWLLFVGGIAAVAILGGTGLSLANIAKNISYRFLRATRPNVQVNLSGINLSFSIFYEITNRNSLSATLQGFAGQVFYKGQPISNLSLASPVEIQANSSAQVELRLQTSILDTLSELITIFTTRGVQFFVEVKGRLMTSVGDVPIKTTVPLSI